MSSQSSSRGSGVHGSCEDTRSISAITGAWPGASSSRSKAASVYWSGTAAKLNLGPSYPTSDRS